MVNLGESTFKEPNEPVEVELPLILPVITAFPPTVRLPVVSILPLTFTPLANVFPTY